MIYTVLTVLFTVVQEVELRVVEEKRTNQSGKSQIDGVCSDK